MMIDDDGDDDDDSGNGDGEGDVSLFPSLVRYAIDLKL